MRAADGPAVVTELLNVQLEREGSRWVGHCPWHDDEKPSFAVYLNHAGYWRVGCWACGEDLDLVELVVRERGGSSEDAVRYLLTGPALDDEKIGRLPERQTGLAGFWAVRAAAAVVLPDRGLIEQLWATRRFTVPWHWVHARWRVGTERDAVVIPHFDVTDELTAVKLRRAQSENAWEPKAIPGSRLEALYGCWREQRFETVLVCEGESDTWHASYWLRDVDIDVVGLPAGAGTTNVPATWLDFLGERRVLLALDGDTAGERTTEMLLPLLPGAEDLNVMREKDLTSMGSAWLEAGVVVEGAE